MIEDHLDALRYTLGNQDLDDEIGMAIAEEIARQSLEPENLNKIISFIGIRHSSTSLKEIVIISSDPHPSSPPNIDELMERINGPKLIQETVFEYKKEDEIEPNYWQKKPSIFLKSIGSQKSSKKPYKQRRKYKNKK